MILATDAHRPTQTIKLKVREAQRSKGKANEAERSKLKAERKDSSQRLISHRHTQTFQPSDMLG
jgi:hypothetical protein